MGTLILGVEGFPDAIITRNFNKLEMDLSQYFLKLLAERRAREMDENDACNCVGERS